MSKLKPKIIVLCHSPEIGGAELALASLIKSTRDKYSWHLVFTEKKKPEARLVEGAESINFIELPWWCYESHDQPRRVNKKILLQNLSKLEKMAASADVLLTNTITTPWLGFIAQKTGKPHVWYVHEFGDIDHNLQFIMGYKESLIMIAKLAGRVLTISSAVKDHLAKYIPPKQIDIIHQAVDLEKFVNIPLKPFSSPVTCLALGAIKPSKGHGIAVEAAIALKSPVLLDVIGPDADSSYTDKLRTLAKRYEHISIKARYYDPAQELSSHDIVLICSSNEALGRVTIESLAAGRVVVGFDCVSTRELLNNRRGFLYTPNTPEALAQLLEKIISSEPAISPERNRNYIQKMYSTSKQAEDYALCLAKLPAVVKPAGSDALDEYLETLKKNSLFISDYGHHRNKIKRAISGNLPLSVKKWIRKKVL